MRHCIALPALILGGCEFPVLGLAPQAEDARDAEARDGEARDGEARDGEARDGEARDGGVSCQAVRQTCGRFRVVPLPTRDSLLTSIAEPYGAAVLIIERDSGRILRVEAPETAPIEVGRVPDLEAMAALVIGERLWVTGIRRGTTEGAIAAGTVTGTITTHSVPGLTPLRHLVGRVEEEKYVRMFGVSHPDYGLAPLYAGDFALRGPPILVAIFGEPFSERPDAGVAPVVPHIEGSAWLLDDGSALLARAKGGCEPDAAAACILQARAISKVVEIELTPPGGLDRVFADPSGRVVATTRTGEIFERGPDEVWRPRADLRDLGGSFDYFFADGTELAVFHRSSSSDVHLRQHRTGCPEVCAPVALPPDFLVDVYRVAPLGDGFVVVGRSKFRDGTTAYALVRE